MFDLSAIQAAIKKFELDGWLLYDFRASNVLATRILQIPEDQMGSRRFLYFIPAEGEPHKLVHKIESAALDHLPGEKNIYLRWQELEAGIEKLVKGCGKVAMEYSPRNANPYVSRVDAGTVELVRSFGTEVVSSGNLISMFEAVLGDEQRDLHFEASVHTNAGFEKVWKFIAEQVAANGSVEESVVCQLIMDHFAENNMTTYHPPIVAVGPNGGDPHYETGTGANTSIKTGDLVMVDMWAKMDVSGGVYSDLTRMGFVGDGEIPEKFISVFNIVAAARDAGIKCVQDAYAEDRPLQGWEVDDATRAIIDATEYGEFFCHRTGHSIGQETHGNGANIDNLETKEERLILPNTCFSIEPGIYLPEFGVRSEVDIFVDGEGTVHVTGGEVQTEIQRIV